MKPSNNNNQTAEKVSLAISKQQVKEMPSEPDAEKLTLSQRVADKMAAKVGSWAFLIGQSAVLAGWVGANLVPGIPHWDESPFMMLNLVFSFASAYTAPVVLMSQNRQSQEESKKAAYNHKVNLKTAHDMELLHQKIDELSEHRLQELVEVIKQQQINNVTKVSVAPAKEHQVVENGKKENATKATPTVAGIMPTVTQKKTGNLLINFSDSRPFNQYQQKMDNTNPLINPLLKSSKSDAE